MIQTKEAKLDGCCQDLASRLERANESVSFLKNSKEICVRDMHK